MNPIRIEIPKELFTPTEFHSYAEHARMDDISFAGMSFTFPEGVDWRADITNTGGALLVQGKVEGMAEATCARCLGSASIPVEGELEGYFLLSPDAEAPEDMEEDEFSRIGEDKAIDLAPILETAILLELPQVPLCSEDCAGLCPTCGHDLNEGPCGCEEEEPDSSNPFAVLKGFDFGNGI